MSAPPGLWCCKSRFVTGGQNLSEPQARFSCKDLRENSSPYAKLTGDFANATELTRIVDRFVLQVFAKKRWPCNFRLLKNTIPRLGDIVCAAADAAKSGSQLRICRTARYIDNTAQGGTTGPSGVFVALVALVGYGDDRRRDKRGECGPTDHAFSARDRTP
jgi:hypothetical protein